MKRLFVYFFVLAVWAGSPIGVFADSWPRLINGNRHGQCDQALQVAEAMFQSDAFVLYAPPVIPAKSRSILVIGPDGLDISGGDALKADETEFVKLPIDGEGSPRSIYWQKTARHGYRLVIWETPFGWRGDMYSLYAIGEEFKPEEFLAETNRNHDNSKFVPVISDGWRPPLIFREKRSGEFWLIDVGEPYQFLADWQIHVCGPAGVKSVCAVQFHPAVKTARSLLPQPVRKLAVLLDQTMGQGENEGTLQSTARLRIDVEQTWANLILRPWALKEPYNTREEVDAGLKDWSLSGPSYLKHYQSIQQQYPKAEHSLSEYYQTSFHLSPRKAKIQSAYALDIALRSHYAFHSDAPNNYFRFDGVNNNPWRKE